MKHLTSRSRIVAVIFATLFFLGAAESDHEFTFKPNGNPSRVNVAGDFNNWSTDATPMTRGDDGVWRAKVKLADGVHHYKFVLDGSNWTPDPNGDKELEEDDGHGGKNSGVLIGFDVRKLPSPKPNHINTEAIRFDPTDPKDFTIVDPGVVRLRVRTQAKDVESIQLHAGATPRTLFDKGATDHGFDIWTTVADFSSSAKDKDKIDFSIEVKDGSATESRAATLPIEPPKITTPDWSKRAIWYQIFPERFRNGDVSNDPNDHDYEHVVPWTMDWWKSAANEAPGDENFYKGKGNIWTRRYGGDIQGLIESLPYLRKLGVNAIYLNPMFEADSMHKYDTSDYRHIDDNFGFKGDIAELQGETEDPATWKWTKSDKLFLDFVAKAHEMGFKVILDGVFNHVGRSNWAFADVLKNGKQSKYADWFEIRDWNQPIKYIAWDKGGDPTSDGSLPVFKKDNQLGLVHGPREHIFAITKRWLAPDGDPSKGVDGWRLDVPGDIPHPFWIEWRKIVKETKPDAYITGEIWTWAQPWLGGDQFDAVMNYRWADAAQQFFVNRDKAIKPSEFAHRLSEIAYSYAYQVSLAQQNLFDSHDTDRFASMFVNPDLPYDGENRIQDNGPKYKKDKPTPQMYERMRQAVACQMGFVGAPMIYYGDEAGMYGPDDPSNRMPMTWPEMKFDDPQVKFDPVQFEFYQRAIAARRQIEPLNIGYFKTVLIEDSQGVYAFERNVGDKIAYIVINRSDRERQIKLPVAVKEKLVNWLDESQAELVQSEQDRPTLKALKSAESSNGSLLITLKPFDSAIISQP